MQETWTFDFPETSSASEQLGKILEESSKELGIFLSYYYKREGAIAENVGQKGSPSFTTPSSGTLTLDFDLVHFNACLAINEQKREEMEIYFEIHEGARKLTLKGPYWPEREMDEI
jgi:hypothetical protein